VTNVIAFQPKTPASKARVEHVQRQGLAALKLAETELEALALRGKLRTNLVHEMQRIFAVIENKTHAALFIAEVFEDVKRARQVE